MNIESLLDSALHYYPDDFALLLQHLNKCSNQLKLSTPDKHLPLLIFKPNDIYLWIKDEGVSDYPFLFTDPEEILFILYQHLSTGDSVFLSREFPLHLTKKQIQENIDKCLLEDDQEGFKYWLRMLKNEV
ncbi:hypothetical protein WKH56_10070 [Priestia sp. SB1]|uniref:Uncharacterized protein n=1 Tax=Priestia aryabhattai TaxID=412384 RepID=A0AAX6NDY1_PRIAR|nr:hypothetical protein [Priestia aryabhattai]MDU9693704.1 hypothetical protein [Priestia aryabhattai]